MLFLKFDFSKHVICGKRHAPFISLPDRTTFEIEVIRYLHKLFSEKYVNAASTLCAVYLYYMYVAQNARMAVYALVLLCTHVHVTHIQQCAVIKLVGVRLSNPYDLENLSLLNVLCMKSCS